MATETHALALEELTRQAKLRKELRGAHDAQTIAHCLASYVVEDLRFPRCVVLLNEEESDPRTLALAGGSPEEHAPRPNTRTRISMTDDELKALLMPSHAVSLPGISKTLAEAVDLVRVIVAPLSDAEGALGILLAGVKEADDPKKEAWPPERASAVLHEALPDVVMALRHHVLRRRLAEDHAARRKQQIQNERLVDELRKRNEEMLDDLEQAREFQSQILPRPLLIDGIAVQMVYRPHDAVSGDLHDLSLEGTRLRVFLADTTGHGVRAGLGTMLLKAEYESLKRLAKTPDELLASLNHRIMEAYRPGSLTMTAICYDLDVKSGKLTFASAAHPSAILVHDGEPRELPSGGSFIGVVGEVALMRGEDHLEPGDGIYVYTDGVSEASSSTGELFGEERVLAALVDGHREGNGAKALVKAAEAFTRPLGFNDDVAIVGVRRSLEK